MQQDVGQREPQQELYQYQQQNQQYNPNSTKMDFPTIMTRGKVLENRLDLELESKGSIFQGRDEKTILIRKKEDSQQAIREALQRQIDEKSRKKEEEKMKMREQDWKDEMKIKGVGNGGG